MRLHGRVAVITGSTGGMGEGIARRLATEGTAVVVSGRRVEQGEQVAQDIRGSGGQAVFIRADVARESDCVGLIQATLAHFGRVDILVNNAGITPLTPLDKETVENWDQVFATNVRGAFLCCREVVPAMRRLGGGLLTCIYLNDAIHPGH